MSKLRIGVTSADDPTPDNYVLAIERNGATAVVLKSRPKAIAADLAEIDALLVSGGADIDPAFYQARPHPTTELGVPDRDHYELAIVREAIAQHVPVLAICRGYQILNVAFGGTLHQHIPDIVDAAVRHRDLDRKFETFDDHIVTLEPDSRIAAIVGATAIATNASHHQAVDRVGSGLRVVGRTQDGIIEAIELLDPTPFCIAVQWHPERLLDADDGRSTRIFEAFLTAASDSRRRRLPKVHM